MAHRPKRSLHEQSRRWRGWFLALAAMLAVILPGGSGGASVSPWRVGTDPTFPPFEYRNVQSGAITGFDIDLMEAIGQEAGHPIQWVQLPFDGLIPALQSRSVDAAISAMTVTAER